MGVQQGERRGVGGGGGGHHLRLDFEGDLLLERRSRELRLLLESRRDFDFSRERLRRDLLDSFPSFSTSRERSRDLLCMLSHHFVHSGQSGTAQETVEPGMMGKGGWGIRVVDMRPDLMFPEFHVRQTKTYARVVCEGRKGLRGCKRVKEEKQLRTPS